MRKNRTPVAASDAGEGGTDLERIVFFSDAVFAIAITLLTIEIKVPELEPQLLTAELPHAILSLLPEILVYAQTFVLIGIYWQAHHRMFRAIVRYDQMLIWLNTLFLLCVAFIPVPSATLGRYYNQPSAIVFYGLCLALTSLVSLLMWTHATRRHRLVKAELSKASIQDIFRRGVVTIVIALLAVAAAYLNTSLALGLWLVFLAATVPLSHLYHRLLSGPNQA
jgi:uncharacterized membrane protein